MNAKSILFALVTAFFSLLLYYLMTRQITGPYAIYRYSFLIVSVLAFVAQLIEIIDDKTKITENKKGNSNNVITNEPKNKFITLKLIQTSIIGIISLFSFFMFLGRW
ncbi:hypothetical protein DSM19430T_25620 [Desulfovibrio psychrotolerans]|uniref:Uncharacterized protein n=1 Tax=Desulfovibrio psychrotolerans TaxID=415242 RepID=A0A7J0BW16_9BACT|nr:hypothetical protein DSM19430T_25620 [Desulfovibrio psychrotolerans]